MRHTQHLLRRVCQREEGIFGWPLMCRLFLFVGIPLAVLLGWTAPGAADPHVTYDVPGLDKKVTVLVDPWGISHIYAKTEHDAFFAQGFNVACDRLWQIDLWRRRGLGLLSEVLGPAYVEKDRAARLFLYQGDMEEEWTAYGAGAREIAESWVEGVNAYVSFVRDNPDRMPIEFQLLGYRPAYWEAADVVRIRSHSLVMNVEHELRRAIVFRDMGAGAESLRQNLEPEREITVPAGLDLSLITPDILNVYRLAVGAVAFTPDLVAAAQARDAKGLRAAVEQALHQDPLTAPRCEGSNSWVIGPAKSKSKRAILANDPHRVHYVPSLRYAVHLVAPGLNVIGAGEPAQPGISIGHNENIAWGLTVFMIDQEDLYVYQTNPENSNEYKYQGGWEAMRVVTESIPVSGGTAIEREVKFTRHGPVIYENPAREVAFALRTVWLDAGTSPYFAAVGFLKARDWADFLDTMRRWGAPPENLIFADTRGNIGWKPGGLAPKRPNWDGLLPVPGDGTYEWDGFLSNDLLPVEFNPARGWIQTANEYNLPSDYPFDERMVGFEWDDGFRAARISEVLSQGGRVTLDDSLRLQTDYLSIPARRAVALLEGVSSDDPAVDGLLNLLRSWDGVLSPDSEAAAVFEIWWQNFLRPTVLVALGVPSQAIPLMINPTTAGIGDQNTIFEILEGLDPRLGPDPIGARKAILLSSLAQAKQFMDLYGLAGRTWGQLHRAFLNHALSPAVDPTTQGLLNIGPQMPRGGSGDTVNATFHVFLMTQDFRVLAGASWRMVVDLGCWDCSLAMNMPGQSGDPNSRHYDDLFPKWAQDEAFPLLYSRSIIQRSVQQKIRLVPR